MLEAGTGTRSTLCCCSTGIIGWFDAATLSAVVQSRKWFVSRVQWAEKRRAAPPACTIPAFVEAQHSQGLHAAWCHFSPMATKCRGSAALPAGSHELQSKHPALSKAHSSFIASSPLLCSSQSHLLRRAPKEVDFVCLLQPSTCSSEEPSAAQPTGRKNAVGSLRSSHKGAGRSSASLGTRVGCRADLGCCAQDRSCQKIGKARETGKEFMFIWVGAGGVRKEMAGRCSGGTLSLFVEKVSRLCPVFLDAYQQVIGQSHTQELFACFLSHLSFCRCHTLGAGFGWSHLSLLKSQL